MAVVHGINSSYGIDYNYIQSVYFTDVNTGYIVGGDGTILKTIDAGISWIIEGYGFIHSLWSIHFPNSNIGYAVSGKGILKTSDEGATWSILSSGTSNTLYSVYFTDSILVLCWFRWNNSKNY